MENECDILMNSLSGVVFKMSLWYGSFFERIAKTYRREKWDALLRPLLSTWFACAQQLGDVELSVRLLVEMLAHGISPHQDSPEDLQEDLLAVLKVSVLFHVIYICGML